MAQPIYKIDAILAEIELGKKYRKQRVQELANQLTTRAADICPEYRAQILAEFEAMKVDNYWLDSGIEWLKSEKP